ncbi:MAG: phasin family protein [Alphaproteobacteria bacterium]|jgi:phasin family protein|nr:hypothetical protein [Rhodospirillaceae bacterium]MDP6405901.1 phasin family protein [Alphaproteobacteria bacterium]MDP6622908.1 phasin family protein [Alphaproteobacteria bacterium]|tara:strand:+ start:1124 stop:1657 length:534 start_codon:yes stop_codon:yes gene_type:complete
MSKQKTNPAQATSEAAAQTLDAVAAAGKETVETVVKVGTDAAARGYEKAFAMGQEQIDAAVKGYDQMASAGRENMDAWVAAGSAASKGFEAINAEVVDFTKGTMAEHMETFGKVVAAKSPQQAFDLQSDFAKSAFDAWVARSTKVSELGVKIASEAGAPVSARLQAAMESFVKPFAS